MVFTNFHFYVSMIYEAKTEWDIVKKLMYEVDGHNNRQRPYDLWYPHDVMDRLCESQDV